MAGLERAAVPGAVEVAPRLPASGWSGGAVITAGSGAADLLLDAGLVNARLHFELQPLASRAEIALVVNGATVVPLPRTLDPARYTAVDLWCEQDGDATRLALSIDGTIRGAPIEVPIDRAIRSARLRANPRDPGVPARVALRLRSGGRVRNLWRQQLDTVDHAAIIAGWGEASLARGKQIYESLCVTCHGSLTREGSMPTARGFVREPFKNGADPYRLFSTLTRGFGQMMALPQYTPEDRYAVIHYIREVYLRELNPSQYTPIDPVYLASLPRALASAPKPSPPSRDGPPPYLQMDFGPVLFGTYQFAPGRITYKGIAVRLDPGPGGISKGRAWVVFDHDTMRMAGAWTGEAFIDWKGIAFDGSHNTHAGIAGEPVWIDTAGPGWASPATGAWDDPRAFARDGRRYGPLPREWAHYNGIHLRGDRTIIGYTVDGVDVRESPGLMERKRAQLFTRTFRVGPRNRPLTVNLAPDDPTLAVFLRGPFELQMRREHGRVALTLPVSDEPVEFRVYLTRAGAPDAELAMLADDSPVGLPEFEPGGPARWPQIFQTTIARGEADGPFAVDTFTPPVFEDTPWNSWLRFSGLDFFPDGDRAALCTWNGDVWLVEGLRRADGGLHWRRIAGGLFQPLGLALVDGLIHVGCRDQIVRLRDLDGDGEIDRLENFNNDHQVTEHFHEFAMGLQADAAGNFYYAKGARHALPAIVPQHGTLLRVTADGRRTDIVAHGFRAPNGVCLNSDGTIFVTDQEGHWMPKNRINLVDPRLPSRFFGNLYGHTSITDTSDAVMEPPVVWITNAMDRSPAELVNVPAGTWGSLGGMPLSLSYGTGRIFGLISETVAGRRQGGIHELPLPAFPTGLVRGRFHPGTGDLYACGLVAWGTNQHVAGGFYRIRRTSQPLDVPTALRARARTIELAFSRPLDRASALAPEAFALTVWDLRRSAKYGSPHLNERTLRIASATLAPDARTVALTVPEIAPTQGMKLEYSLRASDSRPVKGAIHASIMHLAP
jgi:mono/diheme cytochrome c family protein